MTKKTTARTYWQLINPALPQDTLECDDDNEEEEEKVKRHCPNTYGPTFLW